MYIMNIVGERELLSGGFPAVEPMECLEVCIYKDGVIEPLCSTIDVRDEIAEAVQKLYAIIRDSKEKTTVSQRAKSMLDLYMSHGKY